MIHGTLETAMGHKQFPRVDSLALVKGHGAGGAGGRGKYLQDMALMGTYSHFYKYKKKTKTNRHTHNA